MAELIIHTNDVVTNEGTLEMDVVEKQKVKDDRNTFLLKEMNRKLDILLGEKEVTNGETNN